MDGVRRRVEAHKRNLRHSRARTRGAPPPPFYSGGCGWQQRFFGAWYEDGGCVQGWLCDLDSGDKPGQVSFTRDYPCPNCNAEKYLERAREAHEDALLNEETTEPDADTFARKALAFQLTRRGTICHRCGVHPCECRSEQNAGFSVQCRPDDNSQEKA